jgi:hypothetical protein
MKVFASLVVAFVIMLAAPASNAVDVPKLEGFPSVVETVKAKKARQSTKARWNKCMADCVQTCWFNCQEGCRCVCEGKKGQVCMVF